MQLTIKNNYDAALPGQLANLPSFKSAAEVEPCRATGAITNGDAVKLATGADNAVAPFVPGTDDPTLIYGIAVQAHSNMPAMPGFGNRHNGQVGLNVPVGIVVSGGIWVKLAVGAAPLIGQLAKPTGIDDDGFMVWDVATVAATPAPTSRVVFAGTRQQGNVAIVRVVEGDPMQFVGGTQAAATGVTLSETVATIAPGGTEQITATVAPAGANQVVTWFSSNEDIASVDDAGLVTADSDAQDGETATITAITVDGGFTAECVITIGTPTN